MKTLFRFPLPTLLVCCFLLGSSVTNAQMVLLDLQKQGVELNPNADRDIKVVTDFINAMTITEDQALARTLVIPGARFYGPAMADSSTVDQSMQAWKRTYAQQRSRKVEVNPLSVRIKSGKYKGDWVCVWGDYTFTEAGKTVTFPYHYLVMVNSGKIVAARIYHDVASLLTQLGYKITPPEMAKK